MSSLFVYMNSSQKPIFLTENKIQTKISKNYEYLSVLTIIALFVYVTSSRYVVTHELHKLNPIYKKNE